jgi:hypothetical protein
VLTIRNLFPDRIAMRLDDPEQTDTVLGDGGPVQSIQPRDIRYSA